MWKLGLPCWHGRDNRAGMVLKACATVLNDGNSWVLGPWKQVLPWHCFINPLVPSSLPFTLFSHSTVNCWGQGSCLWFVKYGYMWGMYFIDCWRNKSISNRAQHEKFLVSAKTRFFPVQVGADNSWISKNWRCKLEERLGCTQPMLCPADAVSGLGWVLSLPLNYSCAVSHRRRNPIRARIPPGWGNHWKNPFRHGHHSFRAYMCSVHTLCCTLVFVCGILRILKG